MPPVAGRTIHDVWVTSRPATRGWRQQAFRLREKDKSPP